MVRALDHPTRAGRYCNVKLDIGIVGAIYLSIDNVCVCVCVCGWGGGGWGGERGDLPRYRYYAITLISGMSFIIYLHVLFKKMKEIVSNHLSASQNQTYISY